VVVDPGRIDRAMAWRRSWAGAAQRTSLDFLLGVGSPPENRAVRTLEKSWRTSPLLV
jgi:hypothetical protein